MSGNSFDHIAQAVLKQKQMMDELATENNELRRQLVDLRAGRGIFVEIAGKRFPLLEGIANPQPMITSTTPQQDFTPSSKPYSSLEAPVPGVIENKEPVEIAPTLELPNVESPSAEKEKEEEKQKAPTFLEEIMLDEFATASTNPMAVWKGPAKKQEVEPIDEEQKAALRRELMGSFLLE